MSFKDKRVGLMNEVLSMIRLVKLNGWENLFQQKIKGMLFFMKLTREINSHLIYEMLL